MQGWGQESIVATVSITTKKRTSTLYLDNKKDTQGLPKNCKALPSQDLIYHTLKDEKKNPKPKTKHTHTTHTT